MNEKMWLLANGLGDYSIGAENGRCRRLQDALFTTVVRPPLLRKECIWQVIDEILLDGIWAGLEDDFDSGAAPSPRPIIKRRFNLENGHPVYHYAFGRGSLAKTITMRPRHRAVFVRYRNASSEAALRLRLQPLVANETIDRDLDLAEHFRTLENGFLWFWREGENWLQFSTSRRPSVHPVNSQHVQELETRTGTELVPFYIPGALEISLPAGEECVLCIAPEEHSTSSSPEAKRAGTSSSITPAMENAGTSDRLLNTFLYAADQFLIERRTTRARPQPTLLAAYPEQVDSPRELLLAFSGLLLIPAQFHQARQVLQFLRENATGGQIPDAFPEYRIEPRWRTADTTFWYVIAAFEYWQETGDHEFIESLFPFLLEILNTYLDGKAAGISLDEQDGLLVIEKDGAVRTWMNCQHDGWEVTPRTGKPIELQGMWYNVLCMMHEIARFLNKHSCAEKTQMLAGKVRDHIRARFWMPEYGYFADVVNGEHQEATLRPNQVLAFGLPYMPFAQEQMVCALEHVEAQLQTPYGLRTLAPSHPAYRAHAGSHEIERICAWHNGIVHPWLLQAYVRSLLRAGNAAETIYLKFSELFNFVEAGMLSHFPEAFEPEPPYRPLGAPASAASLAAVLQAYTTLKHLL